MSFRFVFCFVFCFLSFVLLCTDVVAQKVPWKSYHKAFSSLVEQQFKKQKGIGWSVAIVTPKGIVFEKHVGKAQKGSSLSPHGQTLYRVGSITKVFTVTLMMILRDKKKFYLDQPIGSFIPKKWKIKMKKTLRGEKTIRFGHLATHTSGLPRLPVNLLPKGKDLYNHYPKTALFSALFRTSYHAPIGQKYLYSNLGMGLLGQILSLVEDAPYESLIHKKILQPLSMKNSFFEIKAAQKKNLAIGYLKDGQEAPVWNLGALSPAGGLITSLQDLSQFLRFQFKPDLARPAILKSSSLGVMHKVHRLLGIVKGRYFQGGIGLGWHVFPLQNGKEKMIMHNGSVPGYRSVMLFHDVYQVGVILLSNSEQSVSSFGISLYTKAMLLAKKNYLHRIENQKKQKVRSVCSMLSKLPRSSQIEALFSQEAFWSISLQRWTQLFQQIYKKSGRCKKITIVSWEGNQIQADLFFAKTKQRKFRAEIELTELPHLAISKFLIRALP